MTGGWPIQVSLEIAEAETLAGRLVDERGGVRDFRGWVEFAEAVEAVRTADSDGTRPASDDGASADSDGGRRKGDR